MQDTTRPRTRVLGIYIDVTSGDMVFCIVKGTSSGRVLLESMDDDHAMTSAFQHIDVRDLKRMVSAMIPSKVA